MIRSLTPYTLTLFRALTFSVGSAAAQSTQKIHVNPLLGSATQADPKDSVEWHFQLPISISFFGHSFCVSDPQPVPGSTTAISCVVDDTARGYYAYSLTLLSSGAPAADPTVKVGSNNGGPLEKPTVASPVTITSEAVTAVALDCDGAGVITSNHPTVTVTQPGAIFLESDAWLCNLDPSTHKPACGLGEPAFQVTSTAFNVATVCQNNGASWDAGLGCSFTNLLPGHSYSYTVKSSRCSGTFSVSIPGPTPTKKKHHSKG